MGVQAHDSCAGWRKRTGHGPGWALVGRVPLTFGQATRRCTSDRRPPSISGDSSDGRSTLSSEVHRRLHMHDATTSAFAPPEDPAARNATVPPPPLVADFGRLLHTHKPLTSMFGSAACRLWGECVGSYSTPA